MGTLLGHALPGSFFLLFSIWRLIQIPRRVQLLRHGRGDRNEGEMDSVTNQRKTEIPSPGTCETRPIASSPRSSDSDGSHEVMFYTSATYPCCLGFCARWPLEGIAKIIATSVGMAGELWASTDYGRAGRITSIGDIQHVTMYSFFLLSGILDVLRWKGVSWIVPGLDFIALSQAFVGEWLMFSHHAHGGSNHLEMLLHYLLLVIIAATVCSILAEYKHSHSLYAALATTYLMLLQGTWFIQVGLMLYPPPNWFQWKIEEEERLTVATMIFAWHIILDAIIMSIAYSVIGCVFNRYCMPSKWEVWDNALTESCQRDAELCNTTITNFPLILDTPTDHDSQALPDTSSRRNVDPKNCPFTYEIISLSEDDGV